MVDTGSMWHQSGLDRGSILKSIGGGGDSGGDRRDACVLADIAQPASLNVVRHWLAMSHVGVTQVFVSRIM